METPFWIEKAWGDHVDSATMDDVRVAIKETNNMDDEHGAFWVRHNENENVLEVHKDLEIFYVFNDNLDDQLKTKLNSWQEAEYLYEQFLDNNYEQVKSFIEEKIYGDKTEIIQSLEQLQDFFEKRNVSGWTERTSKAIQQIQAEKDSKSILNDFVGVGMGSLIDLYICGDNGHALKESEAETNKQLEKLTEKILTIKNALR